MRTPLRRYYRGDELVGIRDVPGNKSSIYHFDHQGTTQCLTDRATGAVTDRFAGDAWGVQVKRTGSSINRQWYIGSKGYHRSKTSLPSYYVRRRQYQATAAWSSRDPWNWRFRGASPYAYVDNRPSLAVDPTGLVVTRHEITDLRRFASSPTERYAYTCGCGWIGASHVDSAVESSVKMYGHFMDKWRLFTRTGYEFTVWARTRPLFGFINPVEGVVDYRMGSIPSLRDVAWARMAKFIAYDVLWDVERAQADDDWLTHSSFAYEDLPSNWLGVHAAFDRAGSPVRYKESESWLPMVRYLLRDCGIVPYTHALCVFECMEEACRRGAACHTYDYKVTTPSAINPIGDAVLFHELYQTCICIA